LQASRKKKRRRDRRRLRLASLPFFWRAPRVVREPNTLFSRGQARSELRGHVQRLAWANGEIAERMADRRLHGIRAWEYGMLLAVLKGFPERRGWSTLDVGSGGSPFPRHLLATGNVGSMTTLDLPASYEQQSPANAESDRRAGVTRVHGSMLELPFESESFDFVTCISAIEHLDGDPLAHKRNPRDHDQAPYDRYISDTRLALAEMTRVISPGGHLYLTTDAYVPELQATDAWSPPAGVERIWSAYRFEEIEETFVAAIHDGGLRFAGEPDYRRELLVDDADRSSFRGRYFTTFCIFACKEPLAAGA
jgi:ubiquinone/menaquinone biosynthesis C-methylase UbiE